MNKRAIFDVEAEAARRRELARIAREDAYGAAWRQLAWSEGHRGSYWPTDAQKAAGRLGARVRERLRQVLKLSKQGLDQRQIARQLGVDVKTVANDRYRLKTSGEQFETSRRARPAIIDRDKLREMHAQGATDTEIARVFDCHHASVSRARRKLGLPVNEPGE